MAVSNELNVRNVHKVHNVYNVESFYKRKNFRL